MSTIRGEAEQVILGAGKWYMAEYTSGEINLDTVAAEANLIGYTQGGATIEYTPEIYEIEDDIGMIHRTIMTKAAATMKTGLLTITVDSLSKVLSMGTVSTANGKTTLKLGGGRSGLKKYAVVFVYEDFDNPNHKIRVGMIAANTGTLSLAFVKDKESVPEITFTAQSNGVDDTIIVFDEATTTTPAG